MSTFKVVFMGSNDPVYENLTVNSIYLAGNSKEGLITVLDDTGTLIEIPRNKFYLSTNQYSRNWLAYCKLFNLNPDQQPKSMADFVIWINQRCVEFRKLNHIPKEQPTGHLESWSTFLENHVQKNNEPLTLEAPK